ncbi:MAG: MTH938/NDUFAF3 family protein, partial [candidate division KSB1 bacterium]|nr:MTH938/NDUFAF3 family protein [candidate division KSB1 bacterium]
MIESYNFGKMVIDGKTYRSDVILYPDHVEANWWRKEGHQLCVQDIQEAVESTSPEVVVVGTGKYGFMKVLPETETYLESRGI